jgi:TldD protein
MTDRVSVELIDALAIVLPDLVADARRLPRLAHADVRVEITEGRWASAVNGASRASGVEARLALGVRVLAGDRAIAPGHVGVSLGAADTEKVARVVRDAIAQAHRRAAINGEMKATTREKFGALGFALADTRLHSVDVRRDTVPAVYELDPRSVTLDRMTRNTLEVARDVATLDTRIAHSYLSASTQLSRELFVSTEGAVLDQAFALTQGFAAVVAVSGGVSQEVGDVLGHQRGWEILQRGVDDPWLTFPPFADFAHALARQSLDLVEAPPLPSSAGEVVVVTDPHYNALLAHEIVGHPAELDRAPKMETAYAGRSWLLRDFRNHQVGRRVASPLVSAYSDPALPGYGHYVYDDEGTPARRVVHIDRGIFTGFMNNRYTGSLFGGEPNGHCQAVDAALVPLVRMSTTVFAGGERPAPEILKEVERGYYLAGHRIPSIAESRENFRISTRGVYEIRNGELGQLFRDGGMTADSRTFLLNVDAVGADFRLFPIPNCGRVNPCSLASSAMADLPLRSHARVIGS